MLGANLGVHARIQKLLWRGGPASEQGWSENVLLQNPYHRKSMRRGGGGQYPWYPLWIGTLNYMYFCMERNGVWKIPILHPTPAAKINTHFLWLSVNVIPWFETLKCTMVVLGGGFSKVSLHARATAWGPVRDSVSTVFRNITLHAEKKSTHRWIFFVVQINFVFQ